MSGAARWKLGLGGLWLVLGVLGAFIMYDPAMLTPGYIVGWGTIIAGGVQLTRGIVQLMRET